LCSIRLPAQSLSVTRREACRDAVAIGSLFHASFIIALWSSGPLRGFALVSSAVWLGVGAVSVLHHGGHQHYSANSWINAAWVDLSCPGGFWVEHWGLKHRVHHRRPASYPDDLYTSASSLFRFHPAAPHRQLHQFQHVYIVPAYGFYWMIDQGSQLKFLWKGRLPFSQDSHLARRGWSYVYEKGLWAAVAGAYLLSFGPRVIGYYIAVGSLASLIAGIFVSINHISVGARVVSNDNDWRRYVSESTINYAPSSVVVGFFTGGLNTHSVHHLYPHMDRTSMRRFHRDLSAAGSYEVVTLPTLLAGVRAHFGALRWLGAGGRGELIGEKPVAGPERSDGAS